MIRKTLSLISFSIFLIGINGFFIAWFDSHETPCSKELPINDVQGIIVTETGIYVGLGFYNRIQKYNLNGSYLKCFSTNTFSKNFTFHVTLDGEPQVLIKNVSQQQIKDMINAGKLDKKINEILGNLESYQQLQNPIQYATEDGSLYKIRGWFFKQLVKIKNGKEEVIINQTLQQNIFNGYLIPWLVAALGLISLFFTNLGIIIQNASGTGKFSIRKTFIDIFK